MENNLFLIFLIIYCGYRFFKSYFRWINDNMRFHEHVYKPVAGTLHLRCKCGHCIYGRTME